MDFCICVIRRQVAVPTLAFRLSGANPALGSVKDVSLFLIFGCTLNTILSGLIGTYVLCTTGVIPAGQFVQFFEMWIVGDMMAIFIISTILFSFGTPYIRAKGWIS
jgi:integral membrane sensor domain MASE1